MKVYFICPVQECHQIFHEDVAWHPHPMNILPCPAALVKVLVFAKGERCGHWKGSGDGTKLVVVAPDQCQMCRGTGRLSAPLNINDWRQAPNTYGPAEQALRDLGVIR